MKKKCLFIDRDGTLVIEPPVDKQLDSLEKLEFYPGVFTWLSKIANELDFELVLVTNQDGLGTPSFPENTFWSAQNKIINTLQNENIVFSDVLIDRSLPEDNAHTRKPGTGMLLGYLNGSYDLENSFVIGDRKTDMELAENLGAKGLLLSNKLENEEPNKAQVLQTNAWENIFDYLKSRNRFTETYRKTNETEINLKLNVDGKGNAVIDTGLPFFDHMLEQIAKHGSIDIDLKVDGDLQIDEHHTIEDTALILGEAFRNALGNKMGIERYGFCLPMDDCLAQVALDFGGRNWLVWDAEFKRERIGTMPTELFYHFFKSFSDTAKCNLNIKAEGVNEHHKIESIFKAFAKSIKQAVRRESESWTLPSTKGTL